MELYTDFIDKNQNSLGNTENIELKNIIDSLKSKLDGLSIPTIIAINKAENLPKLEETNSYSSFRSTKLGEIPKMRNGFIHIIIGVAIIGFGVLFLLLLIEAFFAGEKNDERRESDED